ncbi:MAG TPA: DMT family transporter [Solirubrobacterales bacterium]|jgi:drug/metabolite transporter (DMT)-like permease
MPAEGNTHLRGAAIVSLGVLLLSPDALFIQLIDMTEWTLLLFRGAGTLVGFLLLMRFVTHTPLRPETWRPRAHGIALAVAAAAGNVCFVVSIRHVNAALALVIVASAPMFTIVLGRTLGHGGVPRRTQVAAAAVFATITAIFLTEPQGGDMIGVASALGASIAASSLLVIVRGSGDMEVLPWQAAGSLFLTLAMLPLADFASVDGDDLLIALGFSTLMLPAALLLIVQGPRLLSAPETSLLLLLETIIGPTWIWIFLGEPPTMQAVLAGIVILGALATNAVLAQRELAAGRVQALGSP